MSHLIRGHKVQTHNNSVANLSRGVAERVLATDSKGTLPVSPKKGVFLKRLGKYRDQLVKSIGFQSPVTRRTFPSFYLGPRKKIYESAVASLEVFPIRLRDSYLKTFVKAEKHNMTTKPNAVPRVIQPRSPRFNVEVGRYLRPHEKMIYEKIDELFDSPTIMSSYNSFTQAKILKEKWDKFREPVCIGLDASRFDQHVSVQALKFEHKFYNRIFRSKELKALLKQQLHNVGFATASDGGFRYEKEGSRMSGDMNTSLGNKFLMCLMGKAYVDSLDIPVEFVNNGDDCLLIFEKKHLTKTQDLKKYFLDFGFNIVAEKPVYEFEQIQFCQTSPICSNGTYRMVRNVKTCLTKDVVSVNCAHDVEKYRELLGMVADCGLSTAADIPVLGSFYRCLKRFGKTSTRDFSERGYNWYSISSRDATCYHDEPDAQGRYSFWLSTGITPEAQELIEQYFDEAVWGAHNRRQSTINLDHILQ